MALLWLSDHIRQEETNVKSSLQLLHALVKPSTGSFEAREVHQTIVSMAAEPVQQALQFSKHVSSTSDAHAILKLLDSQSDFKRASEVTRNEVDIWCSTPGGISATVQHAFQLLVFWDVSASVTPPAFAFKLFMVATQLHGPLYLLRSLLEELKIQHASGSFEIAMDVLFAIICSPNSISSPYNKTATGFPSRLSLQDAVRLEHSDLGKYLDAGDIVIAEALVRLNRRLDALALVVPPEPIDAAAEAAAVAAMPVDELNSMDLTNMNMEASTANAELNAAISGETGTSETNKDLIDNILQSGTGDENGDVNNNDFGLGGSLDNDLDSMFLDSSNLGFGDLDMELDGVF